VRYRLNDILTLRTESCRCGSACTAIEQIEGRTDDIFRFAKQDETNATREVFPDFIRRAIMSASGEIQEYRARQVARDRIVVELRISNESLQPAIECEVVKNFEDLSNTLRTQCPRIEFAPYQDHGRMTKLRRVINQWDGRSVESK
jgi:phenylacetate-coenzyme A ligase PaaK-like adenylate-forming protein